MRPVVLYFQLATASIFRQRKQLFPFGKFLREIRVKVGSHFSMPPLRLRHPRDGDVSALACITRQSSYSSLAAVFPPLSSSSTISSVQRVCSFEAAASS